MNQKPNTGKGFYAALSLSIAMVGAACWYAYSQSSKQLPRKPETAAEQTSDLTGTTAYYTTEAPRTTMTFTVTTTTTASVTAARTEPAEEAAALIRHTTAETTVQPATTTAREELPLRPVAGAVAEPYSAGELVKSRTTGIWQTHNGADYAAALGDEVVCALDGTVTEIRRDALWGVCVTVLHEDGTVTRYCGLNEGLNVMAGQVLERGTVIGAVGDTAEAEGSAEPHLHFEVLRNDAYLDPEAFLNGTAAE